MKLLHVEEVKVVTKYSRAETLNTIQRKLCLGSSSTIQTFLQKIII